MKIMGVKIKGRHLVKPSEPTWNDFLPLSELDHVGVITLSTHVHFFKRPTDEEWLNPSQNKVIDTLKESLGRVLVPFYPLAGRLHSSNGGRFQLECNAMGAELIEAECSMKISDFGDFYSSSKNFKDLLPKVDFHAHGKPIHEFPVLAVQVTRFDCGGISFGMAVSHVVVDGRSAFQFTKEWARLARGEHHVKVEPFLDRKVLHAVETVDHKTVINETGLNYFSELYSGAVEKLEWAKKISPTFARLTKDKIKRLKEVANANTNGEVMRRKPFSSFEVITAYMWTCVTKARELKSEEITTLTVCVDARGRLEPPIPSSYFGNAIVDVKATTKAGELVTSPLSYAYSRVQEAIVEVTSEYVNSTIDYLKKQKSVAKYQHFYDRGSIECPSTGSDGYNVDVTSCLNLSDLGIDFGWGKDIYTGPCVVNGVDGDTMLYRCGDDGSVVVSVCLLHKDKFLEYIDSPIALTYEQSCMPGLNMTKVNDGTTRRKELRICPN